MASTSGILDARVQEPCPQPSLFGGGKAQVLLLALVVRPAEGVRLSEARRGFVLLPPLQSLAGLHVMAFAMLRAQRLVELPGKVTNGFWCFVNGNLS